MQAFAVDIALLRNVLVPGVQLAPGRTLMARVVTADGTGRGSLSLAGFLLDVELPEHLRAGAQLRLTVRDVTADRVVLTTSEPEAPAVPPAPVSVPLPGGGTLTVHEDPEQTEGGAGEPGTRAFTLRYDAPSLGAIDLRFESGAAALRLAVAVAAGDPLARAEDAADELRGALAAVLDVPATVTVFARRDPIDMYA